MGWASLPKPCPNPLAFLDKRRPWPINMGVPTVKSDIRWKITSSPVRLVDASPPAGRL